MDTLLVTSQPTINSKTVPTKSIKKTEIESKKYDIITTVKNKLHISDEKVLIDLYNKCFHKLQIIFKF